MSIDTVPPGQRRTLMARTSAAGHAGDAPSAAGEAVESPAARLPAQRLPWWYAGPVLLALGMAVGIVVTSMMIDVTGADVSVLLRGYAAATGLSLGIAATGIGALAMLAGDRRRWTRGRRD